jgi:hypothetical protein
MREREREREREIRKKEKKKEEEKVKGNNMAYSRVTRLSVSHVTWNQVQGSTKVGSQLSRTPFGSFTAHPQRVKSIPC